MKLLAKVKTCFANCLGRVRQICIPLFDPIPYKDQQILLTECSHIVVVHFEAPLGAAVIATATLRSLKQAFPNLQVTAIASGHSHDLLEVSPYITNLLSAPNPIKNPLSSFGYALVRIWPYRRQFDAIVLDGGGRRTLITLFAVLTGIKRRIGYSVNPWLLHVQACDSGVPSNIEINNRAFEAITASPLQMMEPAIFFSHCDTLNFDYLFQDITKDRLRVVFVTETSLGHPNSWFADRFVLLAKRLITACNAFIALVGAASHSSDIEALRDQIGFDSVSLAGQTTPRELAAFMANCDFCISVDTGAMHVARSVNLPTVIIGHAADPKTLWLPPEGLNHIELIRKDDLPCSLCRKFECLTKECMEEISTQEVYSAFCRLKDRVVWGPSARIQRLSGHTITTHPC